MPHKRWKLTEEDVRNHGRWKVYEAAVHEMLKWTHPPHAPRVVVPANDTRHARVEVLQQICCRMEAGLDGCGGASSSA